MIGSTKKGMIAMKLWHKKTALTWPSELKGGRLNFLINLVITNSTPKRWWVQ